MSIRGHAARILLPMRSAALFQSVLALPAPQVASHGSLCRSTATTFHDSQNSRARRTQLSITASSLISLSYQSPSPGHLLGPSRCAASRMSKLF
eukprot:1409997-Pleurochrysis_carterae.AAC.2